MNMRPRLESTRDYSVFEYHELNRNLHHSQDLEESMRAHGFRPSNPIHVTPSEGGKLKVKRGHNRLAVAMKLGLPVWYIVDDDPLTLHEWEGGTHQCWTADDFAISYSRLGSDDYLCLLEFQQRHGLPLGVAAALVGGNGAGSHGKVRSVKKGTFKIGDMTHAHQVTDITDLCRRCGIAFATNAPFVVALSRAVRVPEFDTEIFKSRVKTYPSLMGRRSSADDYLVEIEKLYNFKTRDKRMPLVIRAHEIGLERQRTFARQGGRHKS